jgi:hypothetical protein
VLWGVQRIVHAVTPAAVWEYRARSEWQAAARFQRLATELAAGDASDAVVVLARQAAADERRHAALCGVLAVRFGGAGPAEGPKVAGRCSPAGLAPRDRLLYEVVAMSCVTETLSAALLIEIERCASDVEVQRVVHQILRDEIAHSRLGWAHLAAEAEQGRGAFLAEHLPAMLAGTVTDELFSPGEAVGESALEGLGALGRPRRLVLFAASMREVVFPGLERFGVHTAAAEAWLTARIAGSDWVPTFRVDIGTR